MAAEAARDALFIRFWLFLCCNQLWTLHLPLMMLAKRDALLCWCWRNTTHYIRLLQPTDTHTFPDGLQQRRQGRWYSPPMAPRRSVGWWWWCCCRNAENSDDGNDDGGRTREIDFLSRATSSASLVRWLRWYDGWLVGWLVGASLSYNRKVDGCLENLAGVSSGHRVAILCNHRCSMWLFMESIDWICLKMHLVLNLELLICSNTTTSRNVKTTVRQVI